ncbi:MAG: GNAT family N-acetyltransferase [Promethearchaeota archaeon]
MVKAFEDIVIRKTRSKDADAIAKVLIESFPDKFTAIFGKKLKAAQKALAEDHVLKKNFEGVFVAEVNGNVVGVIELSTRETKKSKQESLKPYFAHLGFFGAIRAFLVFMILEEKVDENGCYMEHIAVSPDFRGKGIGKLLMKRAEEFAKEKQKVNCSLYVAPDNKPACYLYEKTGFCEISTENSILLKLFLGKRVFVLMRKPLWTREPLKNLGLGK